MPYTTVSDIRLYYEVHGDTGEGLVLVHGHTGDISDWRHQVQEFSHSHRVLAIDQRGHGRSEAPQDRSVYTISRMAQDVEDVAGLIGFGRYHLVGHSMGGAVVQEVALQSQEKLLSLTLVGTSCGFDLRGDPDLAERWAQRRNLAATQGMAVVAAQEPTLPVSPHMPAERLQQTRDRLARMSVDAFIGSWEGLAAWQGTESRAHMIGVHTLIIFGDMESGMLVEGSLKLEQLIPNSTLQVIPEAGHSPQEERPDQFNVAFRRFLERNSSSSRPSVGI